MKTKLLISSLIVLISTFVRAQWISVNLDSTQLNVEALATSGNTIFVGTDNGVFLSDNNGATWIASNTGLTNLHIRELGINGATIFAATAGGVFLSLNNGTSWSLANSGISDPVVNAFAFSGASIFAGTYNSITGGGVFLSTNNGTSWLPINNGLQNLTINALAAIGTTVFAGTSSGGVYVSTNNGVVWTPANAGLTYSSVSSLAVNGSTVFAGTAYGGVKGTVFSSSDFGNSWIEMLDTNGMGVTSLAISGPTVYAGMSYGGGLFISNNNGVSWSADSLGLPLNYVTAITVHGPNIYISVFGKGLWTRRIDGTPNGINEISLKHDTRIYPNPFNDKTRLEINSGPRISNATLKIYNSLMQEVKSMEKLSGKSIDIERTGLKSDCYYYILIQGDRMLATGKFIVE